MKTAFQVTAIVLFICCTECYSAKGSTPVQEVLLKQADVVATAQTQAKALGEHEKSEETRPRVRTTRYTPVGMYVKRAAALLRTRHAPEKVIKK